MANDPVLLPSLLDRLTDDSFVQHGIDGCQAEIERLTRQLQAADPNTSEQDRRQWQKEIGKQQVHAEYLRGFIGSYDNLRESVKRDLGWLLNCRSYYRRLGDGPFAEIVPLSEETFPQVATSVLNYGLEDLTGKTVSSLQNVHLEKILKQALLTFEPRIIPETLACAVLLEDSMLDHNRLMFDIQGMLWAEPAPIHLQIRTQLDLESGDITPVE
ncbi:MAG: type VI secretion system baseplate subunit TssE [Thiolinea sp.]